MRLETLHFENVWFRPKSTEFLMRLPVFQPVDLGSNKSITYFALDLQYL